MPTLEELEALREKPEQQPGPVVAAPTSQVPLSAPAQIYRPELDTTLDQRSTLNKNLEWQEKFEPGVFYKNTNLGYEEGKEQAALSAREEEGKRLQSLPLLQRARAAAGISENMQDEPIIGVMRGFANPIIDAAQLPGYAAKGFHEADVIDDDGVQFEYSWGKPMTSLLYGVTDVLQKFQNEINEDVKQDRSILEKFPEALGSAGAFMLAGPALGVESLAAQAATSAGLGALSQGTSQYEEALAYGSNPEDAMLAMGAGAALGSTEGFPGFFFLKRLNQLGGGKVLDKLKEFGMQGESGAVREAVKGALTEALQEGVQTTGSNWVASDLAGYDPTRSLGENFWDSVITAGLTGSMVGGGIQMMRDAEVNDAKKRLDEEYFKKLNSGDVINALATPGNGFGSFSPVENLVQLNKIKADLDRHIDQKAEEAFQRVAGKVEGNTLEFPGDPFGIPDDIVPDSSAIPSEAAVSYGEKNFIDWVGGDATVNPSTERAILQGHTGPMSVKQGLTKTDVVALPSRYTDLLKTLETNIAKVKEQFEHPALTEEQAAHLTRQLKMMELRKEQLNKKKNIADKILGDVKNYSAVFRRVLNPAMKLVVRDSNMVKDNSAGWFVGAQEVQLPNGSTSPVGVMFVNTELLVDEIFNGASNLNDPMTTQLINQAKRKIFEVINHELGHSILSFHFKNVISQVRGGDPETSRKAYKTFVLLQEEYRNWLKDMSGMSWENMVEHSMPFQRADRMLAGAQSIGLLMDTMSTHEELPAAWPKKNYLLSFDEFFADMTARLATQGQLADPVMTDFFQPVLQQYQKAFETFPQWAKNEYGTNWKEFLQARSLSYKVREEIEKVKASGTRNLWHGLKRGVPGLDPDNFAGLREHLDRWNKGLSLGLNLLQLEKVFGHIPQFGAYRATTEAWAAYQRDFADKATQTLELWRSLGKKDAAALAAVFYHESETRKNLAPAQLARELTGEGLQVYQQVRAQLNRVLDEMQATALREANREHSGNSEKLALATKEIVDEFTKLKDSGYFPYIRFGDWTITARAKNDLTYLGQAFKAGELITFQAFENRKERDQAYTKLRNELGAAAAVSHSKMREAEYTVQGMPRSILLALRNRLQADGQLTTEIEKAIEQSLEANAPFKNFRNHFKKKQGIHGYSEDAFRTFAHYIRSAAGNISRVRYAGEMRESIDSMQSDVETIKQTGGPATARQEMVHWLRRHFDYIMNPSNELAALRAVGFVAYLGFNIKSAFVNTTQMLTTTYPYLAARYGDVSSVAQLGKAGAWLRKWVFGKKDFFNAKPGSPEQRIAELIARGQSEGWLDQSLATELAIAASENNLDRSLYLPSGKRWWHNFSRYSALPFHMVEKTNRYVTAIAAYNLAYAETQSHEKAVLAAKLANQQTHFENARWNRPEFLRGKKSAALLFMNFVQNQLFFISQDPGATRYFVIMLLLAGVLGLPGADDIIDVVEAAITKLNKELGMSNPKVQIRVEMRKFLDELGANPDLVLHGISQDSFGLGHVGELTGLPIPRFDLSRSLGMGNIVPGTEIPNLILNGGKPGDIALEAFSQAAGASGNLVEDYYKSLFSSNPSDWKRAEKLLPLMSMRNISKAIRYAQEQKEQMADGTVVANFTPYDVRTGLEIFGQALGFPLTEVQEGWEREIAVRDATQFYKTWQASIQRQLNIAYLQEDREAIADSLENLKRYNESVPMPEMGIKPKDAKRAVRDFIKSQVKAELGFAGQKKYERLMRQVEEAWPDPHGDSVRKGEVNQP